MTVPSGFMTKPWGEEVAAAINHSPSPAYRATKLEEYWQWVDRAKANLSTAAVLWVKDAAEGDRGRGLLMHLERGRVASTETVEGSLGDQEAEFVLAGEMSSWRAMLEGYDVRKTVMYRRLTLDKGDVVLFFRSIYYWVELLVALSSVPVA